MAQINWTKKSLKDLRAINDYISLDSEFYASRFISKLINRVDQLIEFPESGRVVPEKNEPEIRELKREITVFFTGYGKKKSRFLEFIILPGKLNRCIEISKRILYTSAKR